MDGRAVQEIRELAELAGVKTIEVAGETFATRELHRMPLPQRRKEEPVERLDVGSLTAIRDYLAVQRDGCTPETHFIHVEGPAGVRIVGTLLDQGETNQRHTYLTARVKTDAFPWERFLASEEMIIGLQARFAETEDRARLIDIVGNLTADEKLKVADDGMTQRVTVKAGIAHLENKSVDNPFLLAPYRTFREIDPPRSPFIARLKSTGGQIQAGLFEADGGRWQIEAVERIRAWLLENVEGWRVIG